MTTVATIHIPPAALEAGARAIKNLFVNDCPATYDEIARAAFEAMVKNWSGMFENPAGDYLMLRRNALILPIAQKQEDGDDADKRAAIADLERQGWKHDR